MLWDAYAQGSERNLHKVLRVQLLELDLGVMVERYELLSPGRCKPMLDALCGSLILIGTSPKPHLIARTSNQLMQTTRVSPFGPETKPIQRSCSGLETLANRSLSQRQGSLSQVLFSPPRSRIPSASTCLHDGSGSSSDQ